MSQLRVLLRWAHRAPLHALPFPLAVAASSLGRRWIWRWLCRHRVLTPVSPPPTLARSCWGVRFRAPLFNAAGMFKYGEGYELAYRQGAGAYLVGTTTSLPRKGRAWRGIRQPFLNYPRSGAALNALGLPNPGHRAVARLLERLPRYPGFPIGASLAIDPELPPGEALPRLVEGLHTYVAAGVDFIELNESCPNVPHDTSWRALEQRLQWIAEHFLARRERRVPVVVKVSLDISPEMLVSLLEVLTRLGYDGITLGNTSTAYESALASLAPAERAAFVRFWRSIGGGISGAPLAEQRRRLVRLAWHWLSQHPPQQEFHIIAVGGIMTPEELQTALAEGASLAQWYTGYIAAFAEHGDELYRWMYSTLTTDP